MVDQWATGTDFAMQQQDLDAKTIRNRIDLMKAKEIQQGQARKQAWMQAYNNPQGMFDPLTQQRRPFSPEQQQALGQFQGQPQGQPQQPQPVQGNVQPNAPQIQAQGESTQSQPAGQMSPQMPQNHPPMTDEEKQAARGQKMYAYAAKALPSLSASAKTDPTARKQAQKLADSTINSEAGQAFAKKAGFDEVKISWDEETGEGRTVLTKDWTSEELQKYVENSPHGDSLLGLVNAPGKYRITFDDMGGVRGAELVKPSGTLGNLTQEELVDMSLHDLDAEKRQKAKETLEASGEYKKSTSVTAMAQNTEPFTTWNKSDKEWWFQNKKDTGDQPRFGFGDKKSFSQFNREYAQWAQGKGITGAESKTGGETFKALSSSLKNQQKVESMMSGFVRNLDFQAERLNKNAQELSRLDYRILNVPMRSAAMMIKGSPKESILSMYLTDISNDVAKLSTGSSASVAELSQNAQERWNKIHDPNLSIKDLIALVDETKIAAHGRIITTKDEMESTRQQMRHGSDVKETKKEEVKKMTFNPETGEIE
jgi:hypothetical protein